MTAATISTIASIPSPSSASLEIGPLELRAYGLLIALGVIAGVWLLGRMLERKGIGTADDASAIGMWGVGAGIVGARLYHVATEWSRFSDDLGAIPKIWEGGLGIPGGLLAGVARRSGRLVSSDGLGSGLQVKTQVGRLLFGQMVVSVQDDIPDIQENVADLRLQDSELVLQFLDLCVDVVHMTPAPPLGNASEGVRCQVTR